MRQSIDNAASIRDTFQEQGFYLAKGVFSPEEVDALEAEFDFIAQRLVADGESANARWNSDATDQIDAGSSVIYHTHNVHRYSAAWLGALTHKSFLDTAESILGPNIILHHNKLFLKPPENGSPFPMHQDWWYFPTEQDTMIAGVVFLGDTDDDMGGFRVYPGSHKLRRQENSSGLRQSALLEKYPIQNATPVPAQKGDVLFFSYFTLHGSMPNRSDKIRKTVLIQLYSGEDIVELQPEVNHHDEMLTLRGRNYRMNRARAGS